MNISEVSHILRDGRESLEPLIDFYSQQGRDVELSALIEDREISTTVLYMLSEMPFLHLSTLEAVRKAAERGMKSDALVFAKDILNNSRIRR